MKVLIIVAHGSKKKESNKQVALLSKKIAAKTKKIFDAVDYAFLQFAFPLFEDKIDCFIQKGALHITIFPFFVSSGSHVLIDIPQLIQKAQSKYKHVDFKITKPIIKADKIVELIIDETTKNQKV